MLEPLRKPVADRIDETRLAQDGRVDQAGEHRLARARLFGFASNLSPNRIEALDLRSVGPGLLHGEQSSSAAAGQKVQLRNRGPRIALISGWREPFSAA